MERGELSGRCPSCGSAVGAIAPAFLVFVGLEKAISASYRLARQIVILVVGLTVLATGVAMLVLPGPGLVTVFLGLTILAVEFAWARYWLKKLKETGGHAQRGVSDWFFGRKNSPPPAPAMPPKDPMTKPHCQSE